MNCTGRIKDIGRSLSGKFTVTLEVDGTTVQELQKLSLLDKLAVEIKKYRAKRSLDANAYYWVLVQKIAHVTGDSTNRIHNMLLDQYGVLDTMPDGHLIPMCILDSIDHLEFAYPHLKPTQKTLSKGDRLFRWYYQIKGSSEYNSKEMSDLINGAVAECQQMGIETLPPAEIERMMALYGKKHDKAAAV